MANCSSLFSYSCYSSSDCEYDYSLSLCRARNCSERYNADVCRRNSSCELFTLSVLGYDEHVCYEKGVWGCGCILWCAHPGRLSSSLRQHQLTGGLRVVLCTLCVLVCRQWLLCTRYGEHASISTALTALQTSRFRATSLTMWSTATTHQDVCTTTSWTTAATPVSDVVMCMDVHHCCAGEPRGFDCRELDEVSCGETGGECEYRSWRRGCFPRSL